MIADAKKHPKDPGLATAVGPRFDVDRAAAVAGAFIEGLKGPAMRYFPGGPPRLRIGYDGRTEPMGPDALARLRDAFRERRKRYDVDDFEVRFELGRLCVRARLLGYDALYLAPNGIKTIDGQDPGKLDPTPILAIHRRDAETPQLTEAQRKLVTKVCLAARPQGVEAAIGSDGLVPPICFITFPHAAFGAGQGALRIRLVR